jgi:hypothetical protein
MVPRQAAIANKLSKTISQRHWYDKKRDNRGENPVKCRVEVE